MHKSFRADTQLIQAVLERLGDVPFSLLVRKLLEHWLSGRTKVEL